MAKNLRDRNKNQSKNRESMERNGDALPSASGAAVAGSVNEGTQSPTRLMLLLWGLPLLLVVLALVVRSFR